MYAIKYRMGDVNYDHTWGPREKKKNVLCPYKQIWLCPISMFNINLLSSLLAWLVDSPVFIYILKNISKILSMSVLNNLSVPMLPSKFYIPVSLLSMYWYEIEGACWYSNF